MKDYRELRAYYRALADVTRLRILHELSLQAETTVTALCAALDVTQPLMSWHLRILRRVGLVQTSRRGRLVHCSLNHRAVADSEERLQKILVGTPSTAGGPGRRDVPAPAPSH